MTLLASVAGMAACAPALNWREIRLEGTSLSLTLPCKPSSYARGLSLAGQPVQLQLRVCRAADSTWAVAHADIGDPARVPAALTELQRSTIDNSSATVQESSGFHRKGFTPQPGAVQLWLQGRLPDGTVVRSRVALFSIGTQVFQASQMTVGPVASDPAREQEAWEMLLSSLRALP